MSFSCSRAGRIGSSEIDVNDWRMHTGLQGYAASDPIVGWFWDEVTSMSSADRALLLQFATGLSRLPPGGFARLSVRGGASNYQAPLMIVYCRGLPALRLSPYARLGRPTACVQHRRASTCCDSPHILHGPCCATNSLLRCATAPPVLHLAEQPLVL